jgi:hypothetical protein
MTAGSPGRAVKAANQPTSGVRCSRAIRCQRKSTKAPVLSMTAETNASGSPAAQNRPTPPRSLISRCARVIPSARSASAMNAAKLSGE